MERSYRIARIQALMSRATGVTMAQLMHELETSRATVNRDLELMRSQMNAPIVWDRDTYSYRLDPQQAHGTTTLPLPGVWLNPAQAYALLTLNNMVEQIAPQLLGPFVNPMRGMLKEMLGQMEHPMYGLDKKISIDMPGMPSINDLMFSTLMQALLEDLPIAITVKTPEGSEQDHEGIPRHLRIRHDGWQLQLQTGSKAVHAISLVNVIDVALITHRVNG
jgi:predicted DNA-binding transcriptional regulator YafY